MRHSRDNVEKVFTEKYIYLVNQIPAEARVGTYLTDDDTPKKWRGLDYAGCEISAPAELWNSE